MSAHFHLTLSALGGIVAGFITTVFVNQSQSQIYLGQLLAGNQTVNRTMPTTLNALKTVTDGTDPMITGLTSMGFWVTFAVLSVIASGVLFRWMRRFV
jgi:hypothetical protein